MPISIEKMYVIRNFRKKISVEKRSIIKGHRHSNLDKFQINRGTDLSYGSELFKAASIALQKHPPLRITISRFGSAIGRGSDEDRLIDLCIALESIFQTNTEISFQFVLYNAILSESELEKISAIFATLKRLYSERSSIVHGNKGIDLDWLKEKWPDLLGITKASILRKIDFLQTNEHKDWKHHLERLALGIADGKEAA